MDRVTIAKAMHRLEELISVLDNAYWETSDLDQKDRFYDLISAFQLEVSELSKLSVEDHYMAYEPISLQAKNALGKLKTIHSSTEEWIPRSKTAAQLNGILPAIIQLLTPQA